MSTAVLRVLVFFMMFLAMGFDGALAQAWAYAGRYTIDGLRAVSRLVHVRYRDAYLRLVVEHIDNKRTK